MSGPIPFTVTAQGAVDRECTCVSGQERYADGSWSRAYVTYPDRRCVAHARHEPSNAA